MLITHFTHPEAFRLIQTCGYIDLEGCNADKGWCSMSRKNRRFMYNKIGRYVWLTEADRAFSASGQQVAIRFHSEDIGARAWRTHKLRFRRSRDGQRMVECLDQTARELGDDSNHYWLTDSRIDLSRAVSIDFIQGDYQH